MRAITGKWVRASTKNMGMGHRVPVDGSEMLVWTSLCDIHSGTWSQEQAKGKPLCGICEDVARELRKGEAAGEHQAQ